DEGRDVATAQTHARLGDIVREHGGVFATAGVVVIAIAMLRSARQVVIPLWGSSIGLAAGEVGVLFGLSSAIDLVMFYPAGIVMDRFGRKWTAIPCLLALSA